MRDVLGVLVHFSIYVFNFVIAYLFLVVDRHTFGWADIDPWALFWVHLGNAILLPIGIIIVFVLFPRWGKELRGEDLREELKVVFAACWLLAVLFFLFRDILSGFEHKYVLDISNYIKAFIFYVLPTVLGDAAIGLTGKLIAQAKQKLKRKAMVQGTQSETISPTNHREVKADKPIVWNFAEYGKRWVVGQDHVIDTIQKVLIANSKLADLGNPRRQRILASFLFVGPTGVGKTETAKALAGWLEDYGYSSLRLDANQFSDREATWTLLGSPKGYVGSDRPGLLPYAISQNPKQVILIDEIEKADQGFYQFLLQMLDEGYVIERSTGYRYYLQRAIVIITSNLENKRIAEIMETLKDPIQIDIAVRKTLESAMISFGGGRNFRITPEFLGRIDAVIPFRSLGFEDLVKIAYRDLRGLGVNISYETARALTQKYYPIAKEYGVRYFLKKIQEDVLTQ
jgi:ATP-dependent Clp protease ATP-binding subunit ClpA